VLFGSNVAHDVEGFVKFVLYFLVYVLLRTEALWVVSGEKEVFARDFGIKPYI
jgi:hypothetical protein